MEHNSTNKINWKKTTDTSQIGNYIYGLAINEHGHTYTIKYIGQASEGNNRCFQHEEEAKKYSLGYGTSNEKKVKMINYYISNQEYKIIILAYHIPSELLNTMENIYRTICDYGYITLDIINDEVVNNENLTNIAYTHNNDITKTMVEIPMTIKQIENNYTNKIYLTNVEISEKLETKNKVLYVINRGGIRSNGIIGWWNFSDHSLKDIDYIVFTGENEVIEYIFNVKDINFILNKTGKKGFKATNLTNYIDKIKLDTGIPCFGINCQKGFKYL